MDLTPWIMPPVVLDCGSYFMKGGFSTDNHPLSIIRSVVGRPSYLNGGYGRYQYYEVLFAEEAINNTEYDQNQPIVDGKIVHWDNMERLWHHMLYTELKVAPEDRAILLGISPAIKINDKIQCCEILFEALNLPAACIQPNPALAIFASGKITGIVVDLGYDTTEIIAVYEGGIIGYTYINTGFAGRQVSMQLKKSLDDLQIDLGPAPSSALDKIMQEVLFITPDVSMPRKRIQKYIDHPNKDDYLDLTEQAFFASEMYFQPDFVAGKKTKYKALIDAILTCARRCDPDLRQELFKAVVLSGGFANIPGMAQRIELELNAVLEKPATVIVSDEAHVIAWTGGACFAGIPEAYRLWVTKKQFEEHGDRFIRNRFIP